MTNRGKWQITMSKSGEQWTQVKEVCNEQKTKQKWTRQKKKRGGAWEEMHGNFFEELWVVLNKQKKKKKEFF